MGLEYANYRLEDSSDILKSIVSGECNPMFLTDSQPGLDMKDDLRYSQLS